MLMSVDDFVIMFNDVMREAVGELDTQDPEEMGFYRESVVAMMKDSCGDCVEFIVADKKGRIKLVGEQNANQES